ncbi:DNA polymerase III subunit beta [Myxococcota bacterium]|nr:DNA polymerase III subunit beta [Myxococcota bacterium]
MKITLNKSTFLNGLFLAQKISEGNASIQPILSNIQITANPDGKIFCRATDMSTSVTSEFQAEVFAQGTATVNGKLLYQLVSNLAGKEVTLEKKENAIFLTSHKSRFELNGLRDEDFPNFNFYEDSAYVSFESQILRELLDHTLFAVATDETKPHLGGIYLVTEKNIAKSVATDGHKLALAEYPFEGKFNIPNGIIIPRKGVNDIMKMLSDDSANVGLFYDKELKILGLKTDSTKMNIKLIDSKFPPYEQVIPQYQDNKLVIPKEEFLGALKRINLLFEGSDAGVILKIQKDGIVLTGIDTLKGKGTEEIEVDYTGEKMQIAFNIKFFDTIVNKIQGKEFSIFLHNPKSPALIKPIETSNFIAVLMPIRLD